MYQMICYEKCSTCKKAQKKLDELNIEYVAKDVKKEAPNRELLLSLLKRCDKPQKMFNTSGKLYREMGLAKRVKDMSIEDMADVLAQDGMLVKRPILFDEKTLIIGYKEEVYEALKK